MSSLWQIHFLRLRERKGSGNRKLLLPLMDVSSVRPCASDFHYESIGELRRASVGIIYSSANDRIPNNAELSGHGLEDMKHGTYL